MNIHVGFAVLTLVLYLLCAISSTLKYYLKMLIFVITSGLAATLIPIPFFIIRPRDYRNALWPAASCRFVLRLLGVSYEVRGLENINRKHGSVVLINHQSGIDLAVLAHLWPIIGRATVVSKRAVLYFIPFGTAAYLWGTLFIDRRNNTDAIEKLNKEAKYIKEMAGKLLFFPEGTRNASEKLLPFKRGCFHIAIQSQSNIQPVVVSRYTFLDANRKIFGSGRSIIDILPEISCEGLSKDDLTDLVEKTHHVMQERYDKLNEEINLET